MAGIRRGRGKKKMRLLSEIIEQMDRVPTKKPAEQQIRSELPTDILQMIISQLTLRDNIRASVVCKSWLSAAIAVRHADKPPLLMIFPKAGDFYEFYDPSQRKSNWLELPELHGSRILYVKDDWLLVTKPSTSIIFFFSPYTREIIELPDININLTYRPVAFSAAPTSPDCIVFATTKGHIITCRPGETEWTSFSYQNCPQCYFSFQDKIVIYKGLFYCMRFPCHLGIYNPYTVTWNAYSIRPHENFLVHYWSKIKYAVEHDGDILVAVAYSAEDPEIYKLDLTNKVWLKMVTLEGLTFFANRLSSIARTDLLGIMRNKIYFSKVQYYGKHCISYSLDEERYYPRNEWYDWAEEDLLKSIWIEPPENLSAFH